MHPTLELVERYEELLQRHADTAPYDYPSIFPTGGFFVRRRSQRKLAALKRLDEPLRAMLRADERVLYLSSGSIHSALESYLFGIWGHYLNRRALVLTDQRLILLQIDSRDRPRGVRAQIPLGGIVRIGGTALGNTMIRVASRKRYVLTNVPRADRKALQERLVTAQARRQSAVEGRDMEALCPHCAQGVSTRPTECPHCGGGLKSARKAALLSLILPGVGHAYLGHWTFGIFEILVAALVWSDILVAIARTGVPAAAFVVQVLVILGIGHGIAALGTYAAARKHLYPAGASAVGGGRQPSGRGS